MNHTNKIIVLNYDDENLSLDLISSFDYGHEVWLISSLSSDPSNLLVATKDSIELLEYNSEIITKESLSLPSRATSLSWDENLYCSTSSQVFSIDLQSQTLTPVLEKPNVSVCRIDPHHKFLLAVGYSDSLVIYDSRDKSNRYTISPIHGGNVLDLDFNPNNPYHLASSGKDYAIKFWDIRKQGCLKSIVEHSHYVWQIKYNAFHDQLIVSASSDNSIGLHRVVSASSAPVDESFFEKESDLMVLKVDSFEDSVYAVTWLSGEAWHFASVSYDGKVVVTAVPSEEKYKILL